MKRSLLVLRHGKAAGERGGGDDFERPLTRGGAKDAAAVGGELKELGWIPQQVLCSSALRARETAAAVLGELGVPADAPFVHQEDLLYNAPLEVLMQYIAACPARARRVLVVGHNPGLDELVEYLADEPPPRKSNGKLMTTATLAWLETEATWRTLGRGGAHLERLLRD